ncbi:MAG: Mov34/MPN/PAD-1 family protein [Candidatus Zixiibacteriota bacterium]
MLAECSRRGTVETGGILAGRYDAQLRIANVAIATAPPPDSRSGHAWFRRGTAGLQSLLEQLWRTGDYYLGEWHYHPGGAPTPSRQDIDQMRAIASDRRYACPEPVLVICGGSAPSFDHAAYVWERGNLISLVKCHAPLPSPPTDPSTG